MTAATHRPSGNGTRFWHRGAVACLLPALAGCTADLAASAFGSIALVLVAVGGVAVGWLLAAQRHGRALQESRQQLRLLRQVAGGQGFQTDATHRLLPGDLGEAGRPLWETFEAGPTRDALRSALQRQVPIDALPVTRAGASGTALELSAAPLHGPTGDFAGYAGLVRPTAVGGPAAQALGLLIENSALATLAVVRSPGAERWQVLHASTAGRQHFGDAPQMADAQVRDALPEPLRASWEAGHAGAEGQGWHWRRLAAPSQELCVLWQDAGAPAVADERAAFTYTVSHDLRAPIRVVEGFTRIVKEDYGERLDRVANDHLDRILGAAARMNQMIDALLTLARLSSQPLARQPVDLSQLAGYVIDDLRRQAPDREAVVDIEPGLQVQGDPTLLRLVLENLLGNAWKYTSQRPQARILFGRETIDGRAVYVVRDNGAGFDMRAADRLFGLFQRLHSAADFPGTGIGLASVRRIVQRHGGEIWADAEPGRGAAFHFTLRD